MNRTNKPLSLLTLILVLLQLLNPFLHAHANGLAGAAGLHVHAQQGEFGDDLLDRGLSIASADGDHRVLGMPTGQRFGESIKLALDQSGWSLRPAALILADESDTCGTLVLDPRLPCDYVSDHPPPPALAPPLN